MSIDSKNSLVRSGSKCRFTRSEAKRRVASAIVALGLLLAPAASGQGPGDCLILGPLIVECGATQTWLGSIPVAQNTYSSSWQIINNNTGATIVGPSSCASVPVPIGACPVSVNVGTVGQFTLKLTHVTSMGAMPNCTRLITVVDTTPPTIVCPPDTNVECGFSTDPSATGNPLVVDCSPTLVVHADVAGATNCAGTAILRTWIATDTSGNVSQSCTQTITIVDTTAPTITCPPLSVQCYAQVPPPSTVPASDSCGGTVTVTHVGDSAPSNGTSNCNNVIMRTYQATDTCGNTSTCVQTITINDTMPPVITSCPADVTLPCGSNTTPFNPLVGYAIAMDNCSNIDATSTNVVTGACPGTQVITRTWHATDSCGNTASCVQIITLTPAPSSCIPTTFASMGGGCGTPAPTLYTSIGTISDPLTLLVAGAPANAPVVLGAQLGPFSTPLVFGNNCTLYLDPTDPATLLTEQVADANGMWSLSFPLWMAPQLFNVNIRLQAGVLSNGLVNLTDAVAISAGACPPFCTYAPAEWSGGGLPGALYDASWLTVFSSGLDLGIFDPSNGNSAPNGLRFTGDAAGRVALKQTMATLVGVPSALPADETNPTSTSSGTLGQLTAVLQLNIAFNSAGLLGTSPLSFGSLVYVDPADSLNGFTLTQVLGACNQALAGQGLPAGHSFDSLADLLDNLSVSYSNCTPSPWATTHLFLR